MHSPGTGPDRDQSQRFGAGNELPVCSAGRLMAGLISASTKNKVKLMSRYGKESRARAQKNSPRPRPERRRKVSLRAQPRRDAGRTLAASRKLSPLARLIHTLLAEKIRFQIVGMSGAILQGVPATTLDT